MGESELAMMDLEKEYGWLLDGIQKYVNQDEEGYFAHYGVKGMKWGVRKEDSTKPKLTGLGPDEITRTTSAGDQITISKNKPGFVPKLLAKYNSKYVEQYNEGAYFSIKDKDGKKVGTAMVNKQGNDELYLNWISIKNNQRGKGYASATLQAAAEFGQRAGFKKMVLEVPGNAPDARHIYEKMGFEVTNEIINPKDSVWGGLTSMEYNFPAIKHKEGMVMTEENVLDQVLSHYGTKGMKWGVRKDKGHVDKVVSARKLERLDKKFEKSTDKRRVYKKIQNKAAPEVNRRIKDLNKSAEFKRQNLSKPSLLRDKYQDDVAAIISEEFTKAARSLGTNASGTREYTAYVNSRSGEFYLSTKSIKHDEGDILIEIVRDSMGRITMPVFDFDEDDDIKHYGVKGMRWGHRKDRSPVDVQTSAEPGKRVRATGGQNQPAHEDARRTAASKQKANQSTTDSLSTKELQELVNRMNLERQYANLTATDSTYKRAKNTVKELLGLGKTYNEVVQFTNSPAGKQIKNAMTDRPEKTDKVDDLIDFHSNRR